MNTGIYSTQTTVLAFFDKQGNAERAISDLRDAGFRADQIGCSCEENYGVSETSGRRSFWDKVGDFFTGRDESERVTAEGAPSWRIPESYYDRLRSGGVFVSVSDTTRRAEAEQILRRAGGDIESNISRFQTITGEHRPLEHERRIQLLSEQLRVRKERVSQGDVRLRKEVHTEQKNIEVPVTREELVVEHVPTSERPATGRQVGRDEEIRVPLSEEQVRVEKQPVVRDEVRVAKRPVEKKEKVSDEVRHEELRVEDERDPKRRKTAR